MSQLLAIETFGTLKAHGSGGSRISAPRRLALLALLSAAGERGMSRDKLLLYLWPESPAEKAKHALEQLIYGVRRDVGDTVLSKGNPLRLELSLVRCDLIEFAAALARSDFATAVRVYAGPFLDGFFLNDSTEFDGWALTERARLAKAYGLALEHVARDCAAADDHRGALEHWHRYGALEPFDSRVALEYMRALAATGNPAGALQHAERHGALLRSELGASLPASIASFVEHLRRTSRRDQGSEAAFREEPEQPHDASVKLDSSGRLQRPSVRRRLRLGAYAIVGALTLATGVVMLRSGGSAGSDPDVVFVAPFRVTSPDTSLRYLREAGVDLLGALLRGDGLPRAVDTRLVLARWDQATSAADGTLDLDQAFEVARRCGAVLLLLGDVVVANGQVTARGQLYRVKSKRVIVDRVMSGGEDDAVQLLHRLGAAVIAQLMGDGEERVGTLSDSIDAVRAYLQGVRAFRAGDRRNAERHFDRALQIDSTFAVAALWNAMFDHQGAEGIEARAQIAWRLRHRLAPADRALLLGHFAIGPNYPGTSDMVSLLGAAEEAARLNPDRSEAWTRFGMYMLVHGPQAFGDAVPRAARALDSAIALDSAFGPAIGWRLETAMPLWIPPRSTGLHVSAPP